jgi:Spy/CpxP family protein refolding chaperone
MEGTMKKSGVIDSWWYVGVIILFLVFLAAVVFAAPPDPGASATVPARSHSSASFHGLHGWGCSHHGFWSRLNLSKEQIDKMREIKNRYYTETRDMRYGLAQKRLEMRKLFTDPKTDDATLLAKQKELSTLRLKLMDKKAQMMIEKRKVLTPEQLQKLDRLPLGHHHYRHHHKHHHRSMGHG